MKKVITAAVLFAGLLGMVTVAQAAELEDVSTGAVKTGEWNSNFLKCRQFADDNKLPLFVFWSNPGCAKCNKMKTALNEQDFKTWRAAQNVVFCFSEGDGTVKLWAKNSSGHFPYMRFTWTAGGVDARFSGRSGEIGAGGSTLQAQVMNRLTALMGNAVVKPDAPAPSQPVVGDEWKRARTVSGVYQDENGRYAGLVLLKAGRVDKKGYAKVNARVTGLDGKSKAFRTLTVKVDRATAYRASASVGDISLSVTGSKLTGTFTTVAGAKMTIANDVAVGGPLAAGTLIFSMDDEIEMLKGNPVMQDWLPFGTKITNTGSKWVCAQKGRGKYDRKSASFVNTSMDNAAGLQLSYKAASGFITGKCTVYAQRSATSLRASSAKITGYWFGDTASCVMTITGAGSVPCTISRGQ